MRNASLSDICLVSSVIDDHSAVLVCKVYPCLEICLLDRLTGRVVREAEIDQVHVLLREFRKETVVCSTRHVNDLVKTSGLAVVETAATCHNVGIHVYRVYRVAYCDYAV